jgi:DNA-binding transcriptional regulator GbsR (MarR family)
LILNDTLEAKLQKILKDSVDNKEIELNTNNVFEREDIQKENKNIIIKIKKQLTKYKSSMENYLMKRATFLKKVGYLVRFSHEVAIYILQSLLIMFKKKGIYSTEAETLRLQFSSWIKELFNEECFKKISKNENIYDQVKNDIDKRNNSKKEFEFLKNIFPDIIKLYFHCFLADIKVDIKYADENSKFDSDFMIDILLTGLEDDKNILFTFLPGLYCNEKYFENSYIYVTTYPIDNPNKFPFPTKPILNPIESDIDNINLKNKKKNGLLQNGDQKKNTKTI